MAFNHIEDLLPVNRRSSLLMKACSVTILTIAALAVRADAQQFQQIGLFDRTNGTSPNSRLVMDAAGNLYGTTLYGGVDGTNGAGTVFKVSGHGSGWVLTTLYKFLWRH